MLHSKNLVSTKMNNLQWIVDVMRSCETLEQFNSAIRLFNNYESQLPQVPPFINALGRFKMYIEHRKAMFENRATINQN